MWFDKQHFETAGKLVVISGGSQGVGLEIAKRLFARGANIVLVSRTESKLKTAIKKVEMFRTNENQTIRYFSSDVSNYEECHSIFQDLRKDPDIVICCAGSSTPKLFTDLTAEELHSGITTNYNTALFFAHCAFKKMAKGRDVDTKDAKHIVFFSSLTALFPVPGYAQYGPLKSAIRSLADTLRFEGLQYNIKVTSVFPGNFESEGFYEEEKTKPELTKMIEGPSAPISSEKCADIILEFLDRGYQTILTDFIGWVLLCLMTGVGPPIFWLFQSILTFILALFSPLIYWWIKGDVKKFFRGPKNKNGYQPLEQ